MTIDLDNPNPEHVLGDGVYLQVETEPFYVRSVDQFGGMEIIMRPTRRYNPGASSCKEIQA